MTLNNETKFPESYMTLYSWQDHENSFGTDEVKDWFKRCIEDFPEYHNIGYGIGGEEEYDEDTLPTEEVEAWFEKWFVQFNEEK